MTTAFEMPSLGADMEAGTLVEWHVEPGQRVARGDIIAVVETQKGAIDIEVFTDGVIEALLVPVGEKVPVGTVLARIDDGKPTKVSGSETKARTVPTSSQPIPSPAAASESEADPTVRVTPRARRRARELGVDLSTLEGTGPGGAITGEDIERAATGAARPDDGGRMRAAIAAAMTRANTEIPHYYLSHTLDLEATMTWLAAHNERRGLAQRLLPVIPVLKSIALALRKVPELNGYYGERGLEIAEAVNLGMAVSLRGGGLVAPALRDADTSSLSDLMEGLRQLVSRARTGTLKSSDMTGATVTMTNLGDRGVDAVFGVIYPPQVALVGAGTIRPRPSVVDGALAVRNTMQLSLAGDHRASDGHRGGLFLQTVDELLQTPEALE